MTGRPWDRDGFGVNEGFILSRDERRKRWAPHRNGRARHQGGKRRRLTRVRDLPERRRTWVKLHAAMAGTSGYSRRTASRFIRT